MTKKNGIILGCCIIAVLGLFGMNQAQAGGYAGISAAQIDTDISDHFGNVLTGGYAFNDFFAVEATTLINSNDDTYRGVNVEIDSLYTLSVKGTLPLGNSLSVFGTIGHARGEATASYGNYSESADDSGTAYSFGVSYDILEAWTINASYSELLDEVDQLAVGIRLNF